jgi:2,4-diketo-3-deoxy-L-fuconate hydrolase
MTRFALGTFEGAAGTFTGLVLEDLVYDVQAIQRAGLAVPAPLLAGIGSALVEWAAIGPAVKDLAAAAAALVTARKIKAVSGARPRAPFRPERIFCAASNYIEHANEMGTVLAAKSESRPYMFLKLRNTVIGDGEDVRCPPETSQLDWEIELAAVIGRRGRRVAPEHALELIAGYMILNDISARDLNVRSDYPFKFDWFQGKCHDTFAPIGPWIVPAWQIADPQDVHLRLTVNDEVMQDDSTRNMIWTIREQIAYLSTIVTLEPGDVVATGTPTGVGMGRGVYLKPGDTLTATIDGIGSLTNRVVADVR